MKIQNHKRVLKKKRDVTELDSVEDVAEEIRFRLWEKKRHMIRDLVKVTGANLKHVSKMVITSPSLA